MKDLTSDDTSGQEHIPELITATALQLAFINSMAAHGVQVRAAREAGYSKDGASSAAYQLMQKGWVCKAIVQRRTQIDRETLSGAAYVRAELKKNHLAAVEKGNLSASNRALELLGKSNGAFTDKVEVTGKDGAPLQSAPVLSDVELARLASFAIRNAADHVDPDTEQPVTH